MDDFDVVVIGAGPAGENAADYAIRGSDRTAALIETELVGGECSYYACMPSKALLQPLDVHAAATHLGGLPHRIDIDRAALLRRRDSWVNLYDDRGQVGWAEGAGITVVRGTGRLGGERIVEVDGPDGPRRLRAAHAVVLATGSRPVVPEFLAAALPWGSRDATGIVEVPASIAVIGGGVVACEAARWLAALGSHVTMLVRGPRLLDRFEPGVSAAVADGLRQAGVEVRFGVALAQASRPDARRTGLGRVHGGPVRLVEADGHESTHAEVLVATGRRPAREALGLESIGLTPADLDGPLPTWLHLVGDVSGEAPLTHWGKYRARLVGDRIAALAEGRIPAPVPDDVPVPQVVFTDPQVAAVGPTVEAARADGHRVRIAEVPIGSAAGASLLRDDAAGFARLVIDEDTDTVLGATFVGPDVAELLHSATIAITAKVPLELLAHAVPSYPTASELWLRLLDSDREARRSAGA
ncbi:dihydrolipoyl dehydrogenase family protein [Tessaracoccus lacteus]|uniref:NAD(P)/FAD-dependent oxidoreductase n=1 Tax=Tessaracoccus lacteus TaxID=3041766 RepID=A0ABY8Q0H4_9ACTN|nr:NAD(P)/FAD-dependent oxidoreductase [Tessaracoccus sp. T21]WGT48309.1 NAD(P)/FAD-dependent oxidoreductase [Tessaracoccus sp. T21]